MFKFNKHIAEIFWTLLLAIVQKYACCQVFTILQDDIKYS